MPIRLGLGGLLLLVTASIAAAQTTGLNPLPLIAEYESSYGTNTNNGVPGNTASGIFQDLSTTWAQALAACNCGTTAQYPSAGSAPPSVQLAANAALINSVGLQPWLCSGCNPAFAAAVAAAGGPSAFQTSGLSTNPADYASADTSLADYFAANGAGAIATGVDETGQPTGAIAGTGAIISAAGGAGGGAGTIAQASSTAGMTANSGSVFNPFSWLYTQYLSAITQPLSNELAIIQDVISPGLLGLITVSLAIGFYAFALNRKDLPDMVVRVIKAGAVVLLVGVGSILYEQYIAGLVNAIPMWFSQNILGSTSSNPASGFDVVMHDFNANAANAHWASIWNTAEAFADLGLFIASIFVFYGGLIIIIGAWFINQILLQFLLVLGPIFVLCLLFDFSYGWFHRWVGELAHQIAVTLGLDMLASLLLKVIQNAFAALPAAPNAIQAFENLFGVGLIAALLAFTVPIFWLMLSGVFAAAGAPGTTAPARFLINAGAAAVGVAGGAAKATTRAVTAAANTASEMAVGAAASPFRRAAAAGPSLSTSSP